TARKLAEGEPKEEWFLWCLCAALLSHVVAQFGVAYWDQIQFAWYALLAIICSAVSEDISSRAPQVQESLASSYEADAAMNSDVESHTAFPTSWAQTESVIRLYGLATGAWPRSRGSGPPGVSGGAS